MDTFHAMMQTNISNKFDQHYTGTTNNGSGKKMNKVKAYSEFKTFCEDSKQLIKDVFYSRENFQNRFLVGL